MNASAQAKHLNEYPIYVNIARIATREIRAGIEAMNSVNCQLRRATVDDLGALRQLWEKAGMPIAVFEKNLTEFQIATSDEGTLLACAALEINSQQGRIYGEAYGSESQRADLQDKVWDRLQSVARNHGLWRLWILDPSGLWRTRGFQPADQALLKKIPEQFGSASDGWLSLGLREEISPDISLDREFELFKRSQQEMTERAFRQAQGLKVFATMLATIVVIGAFWLVWYFVRHLPKLPKH